MDFWKAHRTVMSPVSHSTQQYDNNRVEVLHPPQRQRERRMRLCESAAPLQRLTVHGLVQPLFQFGRQWLQSAHHCLLQTQAFVEWAAVSCAR